MREHVILLMAFAHELVPLSFAATKTIWKPVRLISFPDAAEGDHACLQGCRLLGWHLSDILLLCCPSVMLNSAEPLLSILYPRNRKAWHRLKTD